MWIRGWITPLRARESMSPSPLKRYFSSTGTTLLARPAYRLGAAGGLEMMRWKNER